MLLALPCSVKRLQQPTCPQEDGSVRSPTGCLSVCFSPSFSTVVLMSSLIAASLIGQQYLVSICLSYGPLFNQLLTHPSADFPEVNSCPSMCHTVVFTSNFLVVSPGCFPCCGPCPALHLVFLDAGEHLPAPYHGSPEAPAHDPSSPQPWCSHHTGASWVCKRQEVCWPRDWRLELARPGFESLSLKVAWKGK